jgi:DNA-binding beta-propeller fold protein YncE
VLRRAFRATQPALIVGAAAARALDDRVAAGGAGSISGACAQAGVFSTALTDADASGSLTAGDRIAVTMTNCVENEIDVTASLDITVTSIASLAPERNARLQVSITSYAETDGFGTATFSGSLACDCSRSPGVDRFVISGAELAMTRVDGDVLKNFSLEYTADYALYVQQLTMSGRVENAAFGEFFEFDTNAPLYGRVGQRPEAGAVSFRGAANAVVRLEEGAGRETDFFAAGARGDLDGNGDFEELLSLLWIRFVSPGFFGPFRTVNVPAGLPHPNEARARVLSLSPSHGDQFAFDMEPDPARDRLYVSARDRNEIISFSTTTYQVVERIPIGSKPKGLTLSDDGTKLYVALSRGGGVAALDLATNQVQRIETAAVNRSGYIEDVAESANRLYTRASLLLRTGDPFDVWLAKVDRAQGDAVEEAGGAATAQAVSLVARGNFLYVALPLGAPDRILKLDLSQPGTPVVLDRQFPRGTDVTQLTLSPDGSKLVLRTGEVLRTSDLTTEGSIIAGMGTVFSADGRWLIDILGGNVFVTNQFLLYDANTLIIHRPFTANCTSDQTSKVAHVAAHDELAVIRFGELCVFSLSNRLTVSGQDGPSPEMPDEPAPVALPATAYPGLLNGQIAAAAIDASRGYLYLTGMAAGGPELVVARLLDGSLVHRTSLPGISQPGAVALNDDGTRVYTLQSLSGMSQVGVFDPDTLTSLAPIPFDPTLLVTPGNQSEGWARDMAWRGDGELLLTAGTSGTPAAFVVALNTDTGVARHIGGGQPKFPFSARVVITADRTTAFLAYAQDTAKRLVRVDLQLPDPDLVADRAADELSGTRIPALSPDGRVVYLSGGIAARGDTLQLGGETREGFPLPAPDGSALFVLGFSDESLRVIDPVYYGVEAVYAIVGCDAPALTTALIGTTPRDVWFVQGANVCRVTVPN